MCLLSFMGACDVLWWLVDETVTIDGNNLYSFIQPYAWEEDGYSGYDVGARVKVIFNDGTSTILPIYNSGQYFDYSPLDESGDGRGISTGNWSSQSPLNSIDSELLSEALFQIQLGSLTYNEALDLFTWNDVIAESDTATKEYLMQHYIWEGGILPPADGQWTPTIYHETPEPNLLCLLLVGSGVLLLKRKHV